MAIYKNDIVDINLETGNIHRSFLTHSIGSGDNIADHFGVRVFRNGETVNLEGGSVQGYFRDSHGNNIAITSGNIVSGNTAVVVLPQACYNYEGQFCLAIKLIGDGVTGTVRIVDGMVDNTHTGGAVAPTETVPTYQEVLAVYDQMVAAKEGSVRFDITQELTDTQKAKARENIGAASDADLTAEETERQNADSTINGKITELKSALKYKSEANTETGYITKTGIITSDENIRSKLVSVAKGYTVVYTGAAYWCPVWGYYEDDTAVKLVDTPSASAVYRYTNQKIVITDENIVSVAAWSLPSESPAFSFEIYGCGYAFEQANIAFDTLLEKSGNLLEGYYLNDQGDVLSGGTNEIISFDNVQKGMRFKYSGGYYPSQTWGVIYGYKANNSAVNLLNCGRYQDYVIEITDPDIVSVKAWSDVSGLFSDFAFVRTADDPTNRSAITREIVVDCNGGGDFTDIASAIESAKSRFDVASVPVTIIVKSGVYVIPYKSGTVNAMDKGANKISIIGEDRDTTIIRYITTPAHHNAIIGIGGDCVIENLTFENLWNNDGSEYNTTDRRPYCVHNDYGYGYSYGTPYRTTVRNCRIYDECAEPVGSGLWQNQTQVYEDCEIISDQKDINYTMKGALYVHAPTDANATVAAVIVRNCSCVSKNGEKAISMGNVSGMLPYSQIPCTFQRVIAVTTGETVTNVSSATHDITFDSALNNIDALNA